MNYALFLPSCPSNQWEIKLISKVITGTGLALPGSSVGMYTKVPDFQVSFTFPTIGAHTKPKLVSKRYSGWGVTKIKFSKYCTHRT